MSPDPRHGGSELTRRAVVAGSGIVAVSAALTACSGYGRQGAAPASSAPATGPGSAEPPGGDSNSPAAPTGTKLAATSEIPVGGGKVFSGQKVVVTQPSAGTFKAFSAICTHQGCAVSEVADGTIDCPCHGSKYAVADGSVVQGPARRPLAARQVAVSGNDVLLQS
jgi:Rieske Fe-S protein